MNSSRRRFSAVLLATVLLILNGCGKGREDGAGNATQKGKTFAMNVLVSGVPFWNDTKLTWQAIGEGMTVKTTYGGPLNTDGNQQVQEIEALIAKKIDGLVVYPTDSAALVPTINRAVEAGIPVVTYLNDAPKSKRVAYVTSELEEASLRVGRAVVKDLKSPAKAIVMFAEPGNEEQEARRRGFEMLSKEYPKLRVVAFVQDQFDENKGAARLRPLLSKHPDVAYIFGCNSRSAVGAVTALTEMKMKPSKVTVTGWDADEDVLRLIEQGWVKASAYQNSAYMTQLVFSILAARAGGWMYPKNRQFEENGVRSVPEKIVVPVHLVTQENVKAFFPR